MLCWGCSQLVPLYRPATPRDSRGPWSNSIAWQIDLAPIGGTVVKDLLLPYRQSLLCFLDRVPAGGERLGSVWRRSDHRDAWLACLHSADPVHGGQLASGPSGFGLLHDLGEFRLEHFLVRGISQVAQEKIRRVSRLAALGAILLTAALSGGAYLTVVRPIRRLAAALTN